MAKKLQFPKRRHTRITEDTDEKLQQRAKRLGVEIGKAHRLSLEHSLDLPDPEIKEEHDHESIN